MRLVGRRLCFVSQLWEVGVLLADVSFPVRVSCGLVPPVPSARSSVRAFARAVPALGRCCGVSAPILSLLSLVWALVFFRAFCLRFVDL